jgi:hypothetical protein
MVSVGALGGRGRLLVRVRIRARILVRITRSVCEEIFGFWNIGGFGVEIQKLFCELVDDGGVLRRFGTWEDVYMKRKSIYSILS